MSKEHWRIEHLENAQNKIEQAITLIEEALKGTRHETEAQYYIIAHLKNWAKGEEFTLNTTIPKYIKAITTEYELDKPRRRKKK